MHSRCLLWRTDAKNCDPEIWVLPFELTVSISCSFFLSLIIRCGHWDMGVYLQASNAKHNNVNRETMHEYFMKTDRHTYLRHRSASQTAHNVLYTETGNNWCANVNVHWNSLSLASWMLWRLLLNWSFVGWVRLFWFNSTSFAHVVLWNGNGGSSRVSIAASKPFSNLASKPAVNFCNGIHRGVNKE